MRVVVAPDKFKGSLNAREVAARVAAGLRSGAPGLETVQVPVADGGDGAVDAALAAGHTRVAVRSRWWSWPTCPGFATTDGGAGMLQALGARLTDVTGAAIGPGGGTLTGLAEAGPLLETLAAAAARDGAFAPALRDDPRDPDGPRPLVDRAEGGRR